MPHGQCPATIPLMNTYLKTEPLRGLRIFTRTLTQSFQSSVYFRISCISAFLPLVVTDQQPLFSTYDLSPLWLSDTDKVRPGRPRLLQLPRIKEQSWCWKPGWAGWPVTCMKRQTGFGHFPRSNFRKLTWGPWKTQCYP